MTREEFSLLVGRELPEEDYEIIEKVYHFHPAVNEVSGKEEMAELYKSYGMVVFYDMLPRAELNRELETQLRQIRAEEEHIKQEMEELRHGTKIEASSRVGDLSSLYKVIEELKAWVEGDSNGKVQR